MRVFIEMLVLVMARACSYLSSPAMHFNLSFRIPHESVGTSIKASIRFLITIALSTSLRTHDVLAVMRFFVKELVCFMAHACSDSSMFTIVVNLSFVLEV